MNNFSFRELSALGSAIIVIIVARNYFPHALWLSTALSDGTAQALERADLLRAAVGMIVFLVVLEIIYHVILAVLLRSEADEPQDERDRLIGMKGAQIGYGVLSTGTVMLGGYLLWVDVSGLLAAQYLLLVLFIAEAVQYSSRFVFYRLAA